MERESERQGDEGNSNDVIVRRRKAIAVILSTLDMYIVYGSLFSF